MQTISSNGNNILLFSAAYWTFCKYVDHILDWKIKLHQIQDNQIYYYSTVKSEINSKKTAETTQINGDWTIHSLKDQWAIEETKQILTKKHQMSRNNEDHGRN